MAIDDNTSYELTGSQVKDLANKIKAKAADNIFVGATSAAAGSKGLVPQPQAGDDGNVLKGDGSFSKVTSQNIDWATIVTKLYEAVNGTNSTFQLSESAANFKRLRFYFKSNDGDYNSLDVYEPNGKIISTVVEHPVTNASYRKIALWTINGTSVTKGVSIQVANDGAVQSANYIYIMRVEGWQI